MRWLFASLTLIAAVTLLGGAPSRGADLEGLEADIQKLCEEVRPSLVQVRLPRTLMPERRRELEREEPSWMEDQPGRFEHPPSPIPGGPEETTLLGIVMDDEGYVLTSAAVSQTKRPQVELENGEVVEGEVVGVDEDTRIALVKIEAKGTKPIPIGSSKGLRQGSLVAIFGNPFGFFNSLALGVVASTERPVGPERLIQISASLNPGDEAALVVNTKGQMVGVVDSVFRREMPGFGRIRFFEAPKPTERRRFFRKVPGEPPEEGPDEPPGTRGESHPGEVPEPEPEEMSPGHPMGENPSRGEVDRALEEAAEAVREAGRVAEYYSGPFKDQFLGARKGELIEQPIGGGILSEGIGFVRPVEDVLKVVDELKKHGEVRRGFLGVTITEVPEQLRAQIPELGDRGGVLVTGVIEDSPADRAGIRTHDIVVELDGQPVSDVAAFSRDIRSSTRKITLTVIRKGKEKEVEVELETR